jgi:hypothetical protein
VSSYEEEEALPQCEREWRGVAERERATCTDLLADRKILEE